MPGANDPRGLSRNEDEKRRIIHSLFSNRSQESGRLVEDYITHARIGEVHSISDLKNPQAMPKERVVIVSVLADGAVRVHKARENDNGSFQIGRTWGMQEMAGLENPGDDIAGIVAHFGKPYFWSLSSFGAKQRFVQSISQIYEKFTGQPLRLEGFERQLNAQSNRAPQSGAPRVQAQPQPQPQLNRPQPHMETAPLRPVDPLVPNRRSQPHTDLRQPPPMSPKRNSAGASRQSLVALGGQGPYPKTPSLPSLSRDRLSGSPVVRQGSPAAQPIKRQGSPAQPIKRQSVPSMINGASEARKSRESLGGLLQGPPMQPVPAVPLTGQDPGGQVNARPGNARPGNAPAGNAPAGNAPAGNTVPGNSQPGNALPGNGGRHPAESSPTIPPPSDMRTFKSMRRVPSADQSQEALPPNVHPAQSQASLSSRGPPTGSAAATSTKPPALNPHSVTSLVSQDSDIGPTSSEYLTPLSSSVPLVPPVPDRADRAPRSPERRRTFGSIPGTPRSRGSGIMTTPIYDPQRVWQSHSRHPSAASQHSASTFDRRQAFLDLETTLNELQWDGTRSVEEIEKDINGRLQSLGESNTANVVSLNSRLDELEKLTETSLSDTQMLQQLIGFFVVQLSGIGDEVSKIGGRGNEPQVVAMNQRNLYHELGNLLEMVSLPTEVIDIVQRADLSSLDDLSRLEPALVELHRAVQTLEFGGDQGVGSMRLLQEQKGSTLKLAADFGERVEKYLDGEFQEMSTATSTSDLPIRIDIPFLAKTYPLASLVLFLKESDPARYQSLLSRYTRVASQCYSDALSAFVVRWKRQAEQLVGGRPAFALHDKHDTDLNSGGSFATSSTAAALAKRTKSLRQTHTTRPASTGSLKNAFALDSNNLAALERLLDQVVEVISVHVAAQQQLLVRFFHLSSHGGRRFDLYIRQVPVALRTEQAERFAGPPEYGDVDTSRQESSNTRMQVSLVFGKVDEILTTISSFLGQSAILESIYLIALLELKLETLQSKDQEFLVETLSKLHTRLTQKWTSHMENQVRAILGSHVTKKRHGFLSIVARFTHYVLAVEQVLRDVGADVDKLMVRKLVDQSHDQLHRAFLQIFQTSAASDASGLEDKEMLNHHVTMISNLNGIITNLDTVSSFSVQNILLQVKNRYKKELEAYITDVLHRPIGRIIEFVNQSRSPKFQNVKPKSQLLALKKAVVGFDAKEMKKSTETLRKRVEKHFYSPEDGAGDPALFDKVWRAIAAQYLDYYNQLSTLAKKLDGENALEFTRQDIVSAFN